MAYKKDYSKYYDLFYKNKDYSEEANFLDNVIKRFNPETKTILDLGCGTGNHDILLIEKGFEVTGLDLSEEMIEIAKKRVAGEFFVGDMSEFSINENGTAKKFDTIVSMFSSIGYLTENSKIQTFFKSVKKHLKPSGLLIIDCWNGLGVMNELPSSRENSVEVEGLKITRKSFPNLDAKNHINNVLFKVNVLKADTGEQIEEYEEMHKVRFFFPKELEKYMNDEGFELLHVCPSFDLDEELTEKHWNMILIARLKQ